MTAISRSTVISTISVVTIFIAIAIIDVYIFICVYIYIYMVTPHELLTLVLYGTCRVKPVFPAGPDSIALKDCQNQFTVQENAPSNSFKLDVSTHSTATLYFSNQKPTAKQLV